MSCYSGRERPSDDQFCKRGGDLPVSVEVCLHVLLHGEGDIGMADPLAERLPVDLRIPAGRGIAVPHVMKIDLRGTGRGSQPLEAASDRVASL